MKKRERTREELWERIRVFEDRLAESEEIIGAIHKGEVDALIVERPDGEHLYCLVGADHGYRVLVESTTEGALILSDDDSIFFCNRAMTDMLGVPVLSRK